VAGGQNICQMRTLWAGQSVLHVVPLWRTDEIRVWLTKRVCGRSLVRGFERKKGWNVTRSAKSSLPVVLLWLVSPGLIGVSNPIAMAEDAVALRAGLSRISDADLKRHVSTLASDAFEGRQAGTRGGKAAAAYLRSELRKLRESRPLPQEQMQEFGREYQNLLVRLPGSDARLSKEVIVVGAHYDHVGYGNASNSHGPFGQIHNGADDNASGTSAVLELIEAFSSLESPPPRTILFAFWDGEEAGLLGSKHWVAHPTLPLQDIRFVLNLDMLGRLRDGRVVTGGWRSAPGLRLFLASHNVSNDLKLAYQPRVIADSDHYPFYAVGIPAIHLDTDKHEDYHRPSDDPEKLNWEGLRRMTEFAYRIILDAASIPEFPPFRRAATHEIPPTWMTPRAAMDAPIRLGVSWDEELGRKNILQIRQITANSPASNAGLRVGDRITRLGSWEKGSLQDLKTTLQVVKNPVPIRFERPGANGPFEVNATLPGSPVRLGAGWVDDAALPNCAVITHVVADSPADRAGFAAGDVIMELGGRSFASSEEMRLRVLAEPGPFHFRIERQGRIHEVTVDLFDQPQQPEPTP